jgi:hypothetical protein
MRESDIYKRVGQLLFNGSPEGAHSLVMDAEISEDNDATTFRNTYVNSKGDIGWFRCDPNANHEISTLLVELRELFVKEHRGFWLGLVFKLDLNSGKFDVEFKYKE